MAQYMLLRSGERREMRLSKSSVGKLTDGEKALLSAAAPADTLLPLTWWRDFLSLFLGRHYSLKETRAVIDTFNACY
jgi:hypothetical protein